MRWVHLITNRGPNTLLTGLRQLLTGARRADIAVAFVWAAGLDPVLPLLLRVARHGKVRLVTGLYQNATEPAALRMLLRAQRDTAGRLQVQLSRRRNFHQKLYLAVKGRVVEAIIGSSNLTTEGLRSAGEASVFLTVPASGTVARQLLDQFGHEWEQQSKRFDQKGVAVYERNRVTPSPRVSQRQADVLGRVLRASTTRELAPLPQPGGRYFYRWIRGTVSSRTQAIIEDETDWERRGYYWFAIRSKAPYARRDRLVVSDLTREHPEIRLLRVVDRQPTRRATPDGRHFVACVPFGQRVPVRALTPSRRILLADKGLIRTPSAWRRDRSLSKEQWDQFVDVLKRR